MDKQLLKRRKSYTLGVDIFLLGSDSDGIYYWLEAPSWDCDWYWGFGYVKTYTNNRYPDRARDISSHTHISHKFLGKQGNGQYIDNIYDSPNLKRTTFSRKEGWQLSELFEQYYLLREMSDFCYRKPPNCNVTESPVDHGDLSSWYNQINKIMIPKIAAAILGILSPIEK